MSKIHIVGRGEYLSTIAKKYGFSDWRQIYDHSDNTQFKKTRPNPNLLYPGDQLNIPDLEAKMEFCESELKHVFRKKSMVDRLRLRLADSDEVAISHTKYKLEVGSIAFKGVTSDKGDIDHPIPTGSRKAEISIWEDVNTQEPSLHWTLNIGNLDPIESVTGIQARLNNMAFDCGPVDGVDGPRTQAGVKLFQNKYGLTIDGIAGINTQSKIKEHYGC